MDTVLATLTAAVQNYYPQLVIVMTGLLGALLILRLAMPAIRAAASGDLASFLPEVATSLLWVGILYLLMDKSAEWGMDIIAGFQQVAGLVTGLSPSVLTPSGIYNQGLQLVSILSSAKGIGGWLHPITTIEYAILVPFISLSFLAAALIYFSVLLEGAWVVFSGPIFIALSGLEHTSETLPTWIMSIVGIGVKILILIMLCAVGMVLVGGWATTLAANSGSIRSNLYWLFLSVAQAVLFCWMLYSVPNQIMSLAGGTASAFGFGEKFAGDVPSTVGSNANAAGGAAVKGAQKALSNFAENSHHKIIFK
jgi:P-type conjugative transfer protein TrbL